VAPTSGLAVTAFVLSLVWIGGLGSLLAVVLGIAAFRSVRASGGARKGSGLATWAVVLGVLGLLFTAAVGLAVDKVVHKAEAQHVEALGQKVHLGFFAIVGGVDTITVYSVTSAPKGVAASPPPGDTFVSARMDLCDLSLTSGTTRNTGFSTTVALPSFTKAVSHFFVETNGAGVYPAVPTSTGTPDLYTPRPLGSSACETGFLTFAVPEGRVPTSLRYDPTILTHYEWRIPAG
jgi:hypothetical protein